MLCIDYINGGILFAIEEHNIVNIVLNSLLFNFIGRTFSLLTEVSLSCYA